MSKVYIERAGMLTKEGIRAVCGTEKEYEKYRITLMKNLTGTSLAGSCGNRERIENDYYATPEESTEAILKEIKFNETDVIFEPSTGGGHIVEVLKKFYPNNKIITNDLIYRGYPLDNQVDYLKEKICDCNITITNPPFKLAKEFIEKAIKTTSKYVIMFAKIQLIEGLDRYKFFQEHPPKYVYVFANRQNPLRNGNPLDENGKKWCSTMCFAWFVWEVEFKGEPVIRWLKTNKMELMETDKCSKTHQGDKK